MSAFLDSGYGYYPGLAWPAIGILIGFVALFRITSTLAVSGTKSGPSCSAAAEWWGGMLRQLATAGRVHTGLKLPAAPVMICLYANLTCCPSALPPRLQVQYLSFQSR